jgi:homoserine O-acetyltransferase
MIMSDLLTFQTSAPFTLETGVTLPGYHLAYHTYGQLNAQADNVVWIFHALTANSDAQTWWPGLVGPAKLFDPAQYFIVCVNMPGSCYGSIGPLEKKAGSEALYYHDFPFFTIHDMVRTYQALRQHLGIRRIHICNGGSIIPIATNAWHSAWGKAFNASQRWCIESDPTWNLASPEAGMQGMKVARSVALLSYRHYQTYQQFQSDEEADKLGDYKSATYQQYQGEKLAKRFNAFSYHRLSAAMDSHHLGRGRSSVPEALQIITAHTLVIGIETDILFPLTEQQYLAQHIPGAKLSVITSQYGHDGFLLEFTAIEKEILAFVRKRPKGKQDKNLPVENMQ